MKTVALIVAAGRGTRLGGGPKQYRMLGGKPVIRRTAEAFVAHPDVDAVRCVIHPGDHEAYASATTDLHLLSPVPGGASRQESVRLGLESLVELSPAIVVIHDAARPFVSSDLITESIAALDRADGAVVSVPVHDTLRRSDTSGFALGTVDRTGLWRAQTPQTFVFEKILEAHRAVMGEEHTDDAAVAERAGFRIVLISGSEQNMKITTPDDLEEAERRISGRRSIRTGTGFDVHRFGPGDAVLICGVTIPHDRSLVGHSDADVGLHAITDALLGAIAAGDIGSHFPPSDERWRGADSAVFARHAAELVGAHGGRIENVDLTLICERPKIGPHRGRMVERVAEILRLDPYRVSVKATTTEALGFTGRGEGIAAQAAVSVSLPEK